MIDLTLADFLILRPTSKFGIISSLIKKASKIKRTLNSETSIYA